MARPAKFSSDAETVILETIRNGGTLDDAALAAKVGTRTILTWLNDDDVFRRKYAQAREDQGDWYADKIAAIALDQQREGSDITARVNALKWLAGKRKPKVYGDKVDLTHSGGDTPVRIEVVKRVIVDPTGNPDSEGVPPAA